MQDITGRIKAIGVKRLPRPPGARTRNDNFFKKVGFLKPVQGEGGRFLFFLK